MQGNASAGERARIAGQKTNALIDFARAYIERGSVLPEHPPFGKLNLYLKLWMSWQFSLVGKLSILS